MSAHDVDEEISKEGERAIKSVVKGAGIVFVGLIFSKLMGYVYNIAAARYLGTDGYGIISLATALISFLSVFCVLGLNHGINRYVSFYRGKGDDERTKGSIVSGLSVTLLATAAVTMAFFFSSEFLATVVFNEPGAAIVFKLFSLTLPFYVFVKTLGSITDGFQEMKYRTVSESILRKGSKAALVLVFLYMGLDVLGVAYAYVISYAFGFAAILYFVTAKVLPRLKDSVPETNYRELLSYSWPLMFVSVMSIVLSKTDQLMLGYFIDASHVGIYRAAILVAAVLTVIVTSLRSIVLPVLSNLLGKGNDKEFTRIFRTSTKWAFTSTLPLFVVMVLFAPHVLGLIFGPDYVVGATALSILAVTYFIKASLGLYSSLLKSIEKTKLILISTVLSGATNVMFNIILIPRHGMEGAAVAYLLSIILLYSLYMFFGYKHLRTNPFKASLVKSVMATVLSAVPVYLVFRRLLSPVQTWMLPLAFIIFMSLYTLLFLVMKGLDKDDVLVLKAIERKTGIKSSKLRNTVKKFI